ncbi:hypothetical protein BG004_007247, partial [Podila humilis]
VLRIPSVDFDIRRLVINPEGKLMAIVGDEKVVVVVVTKSLRQDPKTVTCKSLVLGEYYHINKGPAKVVKVLWHPLSMGSSHILIMTQDNILRMYDVANNVDEPEQVFNFAGEGHTSNSYGLDVEDAASFCFGSKSSPWGKITVYSITEYGNIYMMCPVLPRECVINTTDFHDIRSQLESPERFAGESGAQQEIRRGWIKELNVTVKPHPFADDLVVAKNPIFRKGKVLRQGPFSYHPAPIELDDDDNRVYDMLCLETEAADIFAVAHSSGRVDITIALDRPSPQWSLPRPSGYGLTDDSDSDDSDDEDHCPVMGVYESLDLGLLKIFGATTTTNKPGLIGLSDTGLTIPNHPVLVADPVYGDTFYIYHAIGAHCVSIRPWLASLTELYDDLDKNSDSDIGSKLAKFYQAKLKSALGSIVNTRPTRSSPAAPIIGFTIVTDPYLEHSLLLLTSSLQLTGLELTPQPQAIMELQASTTSNTPITVKDENKYQLSLTMPMFENLGGLMNMNGLPLQPKVVFPPGVGSAKIITTEENLRFLGNMVQSIRESLREVYTACDLAQQRLEAQEGEYARQKDKVAKEHEHVEKTLMPKLQTQVNRMDAQIANNMKLLARADELLQRLNESREPDLSPAEKAWTVELAKNEKAIKGYDERKHKVQAQYQILTRRMKDLRDQIGSTHTNKRYGTAQLKQLSAAKDVQEQLVKETEKMVREAKAQFEKLDIAD